MSGATTSKHTGWRLAVAAIFALLLGLVPVFDLLATRGNIYTGVRVAALKIGGESPENAREILARAFDEFRTQSATFTLGNAQTNLRLNTLLDFDINKTLEKASAVGRTGNFAEKIAQRFRARAKGVTVVPDITINETTLSSLLNQVYLAKQAPPENAHFTFIFAEGEAPVIAIQEGQAGTAIDFEETKRLLKLRAENLALDPIDLRLTDFTPSITKADLDPLLPRLQEILTGPNLEVFSGDRSWKIPHETLAVWIKPARQDQKVIIDYDQQMLDNWLDEIRPTLEAPPKDAVFELSPTQKKVVKFQLGKSGITLPREENLLRLSDGLRAGLRRIELKLATVPPQIADAKGAEEYGIRELLGRGTTKFKGSPPNRVKNIARGAEILNGTLIQPDEDFSLLDRLRPFTLENGYLSELVIKAAEGRTVPEIGGGLCQIGTTLFRTALAAGLPITARRNHSYRVSYYEPPIGMDATIYDPAPDFKFLNDTGHWLLLTAYVDVKAMEITFELWGTSDERKVEISEPEVFNFRQPPAAKIIETTELAPGVKKCTERAHVGSDAKFTYKVAYADGTVKEEEFKSRYRPWQEVCLVGVAPIAPTEGEEADTAQGEALPDTLPSADALGVVGNE